jgi:hypothetical protein
MNNPWIKALKKYNKGKPCWCIPRKGSEDHDELLRGMRERNPAASHKKRKPAPRRSRKPLRWSKKHDSAVERLEAAYKAPEGKGSQRRLQRALSAMEKLV